MKAGSERLGEVDGQEIRHYTLESSALTVKVMNYGATVTSVRFQGRELACGFNRMEHYLAAEYHKNYPYFGATIGRYANRISQGSYAYNERLIKLSTNDGSNHLHGGSKGFDRRVWEVISHSKDSICLKLISRDGEEGYPGNVEVQVTIAVTANSLVFDYSATTDQPTPLSLTNHVYFNLAGFRENIGNHTLAIHADTYLEKDDLGCATGRALPCLQPLDFSSPKPLLQAVDSPLEGIDHYFILKDHQSVAARLAFQDWHLKVETTEPGMQVYTANHVAEQLARENGDRFGRFCAICFEPSRFPNGPNITDSPGSFTLPEQPYHSKTVFAFHHQ